MYSPQASKWPDRFSTIIIRLRTCGGTLRVEHVQDASEYTVSPQRPLISLPKRASLHPTHSLQHSTGHSADRESHSSLDYLVTEAGTLTRRPTQTIIELARQTLQAPRKQTLLCTSTYKASAYLTEMLLSTRPPFRS